MISESTMKDSITVTHKLEKLFCDRSLAPPAPSAGELGRYDDKH
jgi:hypothetical protein